MVSQQASPTRIVDEWTGHTADGTRVTYRIIATTMQGFVYSAVWNDHTVSVNAPQGPLTKASIEALFAESIRRDSVRVK